MLKVSTYLLALLFAGPSANFIYAQNIKAAVSGRVVDAAGAVVAGSSITISDDKRRLTRTANTNAHGEFFLPGLEPAIYIVKLSQAGFAEYQSNPIELSLGDNARLEIRLQPARLNEQVQVIGEEPTMLRTDDIKLSRSFSKEEMNDLPVPTGTQGRNFYTQARTAPGVALSTKAHQPFSVSGNRAINNNYLIDSVDNNDPNTGLIAGRGASEQLISQEAIASFELISHNFKAEYGRNSGGVVSVVTKSGSNEFHGSGYEYHNNSALSARNFFETTKPSRRSNLFGFTLGGPVIKNRAYFFGQYETYRQRGLGSQLFQVPTDAQRAAATPEVKPLVDLYPRPLSGATIFNLGLPANQNMHTFLIRTDVALTDNQNLMLRFNDAHNVSDYQGYGGLLDARVASLRDTRSGSIQHSWVLAPNLLNEARFGYNRTESLDNLSDNSRFLGDPAINGEIGLLRVTGLNSVGIPSFLDKYEFLNNFQYSDDLTWTRGRHALKFGSSFRRVQVNDGFLDNNNRGVLTFNNIGDFIAGKPASYVRRVGNPRMGIRRSEWHSYVQDDWKITPALTLNLGVRYELNTAPREAKDRIPHQYLLKTDSDNFAPRLGFAWQFEPKTVLRGGYGIYFNAVEMVFLGLTRYNPPLIQTFTASSPTFPNLLGNAQAAIPSGLVIPNPDTATPYAQHLNLAIERELFNPQSTIGVAYVGTFGRKGSRLRLPNGGENRRNTDPARPDPSVGVVSVLETSASSDYQSVQVNYSHRASRDLQLRASYTFSKYIDYVSTLTSSNTGLDRTQIPLDEGNLQRDRGVSEFNIPHIFTMTGIWRLPFFARNRWLGGWSLSGIASLQSGRPYTLFSGTNNLLFSNNNRPNMMPGQLVRDPSSATPIRLANGVTKAQLTPTPGTLGALGRNTERTDGLTDISLSLSKDFRITERIKLQFRGELFNAFNVTNFNSVDNVLVSPTFGQYTSAFDPRRTQLVARIVF